MKNYSKADLIKAYNYKSCLLFSNQLIDESKTAIEDCKKLKIDIKTDVLNRLFADSYKSYNTFLKLVKDKVYLDSVVIARRIIEILIRMEFIVKHNLYEIFDKFKYKERAEILRRLLQSHNIENVAQSAIWQNRYKIIEKNKELYYELQTGKYKQYGITTDFASFEKMADETGV